MYSAVLLMYFISAGVILLASLALMVQDSLPYKMTGRASVLYNFNLVFIQNYNFPVVVYGYETWSLILSEDLG